jgi:hypothetical protein
LILDGIVEVFVVVDEPHADNGAEVLEVFASHVFGHFERGGQDLFVAFAEQFYYGRSVGKAAVCV